MSLLRLLKTIADLEYFRIIATNRKGWKKFGEHMYLAAKAERIFV